MNLFSYHSNPGPLVDKAVRITCGGCNHKIWTILRVAANNGSHPDWTAICPGCGFVNHPVKQGRVLCQVPEATAKALGLNS